MSGYAVAYGGFLLLGGRMADLFGRRRMFLLSLAVFAAASLTGGLISAGGPLVLWSSPGWSRAWQPHLPPPPHCH
ncbi:hypothetical protein [Protofrankia symbiont of Coriaria ruscifolia]|uniref:hypothetical protein n=1 Tax=Protofrankia symbiont of Coriaria ruscifolia TaxID=1306542 RepID=UPI003D6D81F5